MVIHSLILKIINLLIKSPHQRHLKIRFVYLSIYRFTEYYILYKSLNPAKLLWKATTLCCYKRQEEMRLLSAICQCVGVGIDSSDEKIPRFLLVGINIVTARSHDVSGLSNIVSLLSFNLCVPYYLHGVLMEYRN